MAQRISLDDFSEHVGCKHVLEPQVVNAIRTWFTTPIGGQSPFQRLTTHLNTTVPTVTWNATRVRRALRAMIEDEAD